MTFTPTRVRQRGSVLAPPLSFSSITLYLHYLSDSIPPIFTSLDAHQKAMRRQEYD